MYILKFYLEEKESKICKIQKMYLSQFLHWQILKF